MPAYLTRAEYRHAPTALDTQNLVPGGSQLDQDAELDEMIVRASGWIDNTCNQPLVAQVHGPVFERITVGRDGFLTFLTPMNPVAKLTAAAIGSRPSTMTTLDLSDAWLDRDGLVHLPMTALAGLGLGFGVTASPGRWLLRYSYSSGWPNTSLVGAVSVGATSITVTDPTGFTTTTGSSVPDEPIRILSFTGSTETITVAGVAGNVVTLAAPLVYAHAAGDVVTGLPAEIKNAAILAVSGHLAARGAGAAVLGNSLQAGPPNGESPLRSANLGAAAKILQSYGRIR